MKLVTLRPEEILSTEGASIGDETALRIYFSVFSRGGGDYVPPVIVVRDSLKTRKVRSKEVENDKKEIERKFDNSLRRCLEGDYYIGNELIKKETLELWKSIKMENLDLAREAFEKITDRSPYFLIDGNHRSVAATLTHQPINALELENDNDLKYVKKMAARGELTDVNLEGCGNLADLVYNFETHILGSNRFSFPNRGCIDYWVSHPQNVKNRTDSLVKEGGLPEYMVKRYRQKNS